MNKRRRAKRATLTGIGLFVGATLAFNAYLEATLAARDPEGAQAATKLQATLAAASNRPVVAVLGTSRTEILDLSGLGLDGGANELHVHNFGRAFGGPVTQQVTLRRLIADNRKPAAVLIEFLPGTLSMVPPDTAIPPRWLSVREAVIQARYCETPAAWWRDWTAARTVAWSTYREPVREHLTGPPAPKPPRPVTAERRERGLKVAHDLFAAALANWDIQPLWDRAVRDLCEFCRANGIPFAVYTMPESPTFRSWYGPGSRDTIRAYLATLGREYGAPVFDCTDWFEAEDAFIDGHHLTPEKAVEFTGRFGREAVGPWLRKLDVVR